MSLLNSILSISIAFYLRYDLLFLDRLGTHCLEFFFGLLRGFSDGVDGWERFYRTVCKTILEQRFLSELNIEITIKHRANLARVEINEYLDDEGFEKVTKYLHETAKELFKCLNNFNSKSHMNSIIQKLKKWVNDNAEFPKPNKMRESNFRSENNC